MIDIFANGNVKKFIYFNALFFFLYFLFIFKNMASVKTYDCIDVNKFNYTKPEKFNNSYFGSMSYDENLEPIYIQTPKLKCKTNTKEILQSKNPYLEVIIPKNRLDFYDLILSIDDKNVKTTFNRSEEWFNKELPMEAIDEMHKPLTKGFKKNSEPTIKFKLPIIKGQIQCSVYNQMRTFININDIKENDEIILILHLKGLKVLKQHYFCDCYISQIKLFQEKDLKYNIIDDYAIIENEDDENPDDLEIFDEEIINEHIKEKEEKKEKIDQMKKEVLEEENKLSDKKKLLEDLEK